MPKQKISLINFCKEAVESIVNGNTTSVLEGVGQLPKKQAMAAIGYIVHYFPGGEQDIGRFLRALERYAE